MPAKTIALEMHLAVGHGQEDHELRLILRWSYGSALGSGTAFLQRRTRGPRRAAAWRNRGAAGSRLPIPDIARASRQLGPALGVSIAGPDNDLAGACVVKCR